MNSLHVYFLLRNQQAFQRLLDASIRVQTISNAAPLSSSGGKSWNRPSPLSSTAPTPPCDVNARDWLGRTVLHLAVSSPDPAALEYVRLLLGHPKIDVNLADTESRWTALHRGLYVGNLSACVLLLQRSDIDTSLKDSEGYSAFDVYNSTVEGTKPEDSDAAELFTWGANRNAALGLGDGDDRIYPDQVFINSVMGPQDSPKSNVTERFRPIRVKQVAMSKLHTVVVTAESKAGNLRVCGFGSGGRLGLGQHTQYDLVAVAQLQHVIEAVALGQDHTLALTKSGDVLSWGLNRFSQLGYVIEIASSGLPQRNFGNTDEPIQAVPRRISGPLKKEIVRGIAACKTASACWTSQELFTWGTNSGQLGYEKTAQPVQILPRKVTQLIQPVIDVAITDAAMACLLESKDVVCFWNGRNFKINFPTQNFPSEIQAYRPPMALNNASIAKVASCEYTFAALSRNGEMFTFSLNSPSATSEQPQGKAGQSVKPQRVWALRKQFSAVKDVALGSDGSIVLCTEAGHVYVRSRNPKSGQTAGAKTFKFQRIPFLQRVIRVSANSTGAFAALRSDCRPKAVDVIGNTLSQDFARIRPFASYGRFDVVSEKFEGHIVAEVSTDAEGDDEADDSSIKHDVKLALEFCDILLVDEDLRQNGRHIFEGVKSSYGTDMHAIAESGLRVPAHRVILASRSAVLYNVLIGQTFEDGKLSMRPAPPQSAESGRIKIYFNGIHPLTVLIFLHYLYTDDLLAIWDRRIGLVLETQFSKLMISPAQVRSQLQHLSKSLRLVPLQSALEAHGKRLPTPSLPRDMQSLLDSTRDSTKLDNVAILFNPLAPNVILELSDKHVYSHSTILRARSPFFAGFFDDDDWTTKRWRSDCTIRVNLRHMKWRAFSFVIRYMYCGGESDMFDILDFVRNVDDLLEFMFEVMGIASELLLDRLILICSDVILRHVSISNVCSILTDATHFNADQLVESLQGYMGRNLETLLESRMLDDLHSLVIKQLASFVQSQQAKKLPVTRSNVLIEKALEAYGDWLGLQDIPQPIVRAVPKGALRQSPKLSPVAPGKRSRRLSTGPVSPSASPIAEPRRASVMTLALKLAPQSSTGGDEVFIMDDDIHEEIPQLTLSSPAQPPSVSTVSGNSAWKSRTSQANAKTNLRAIMAEAENQRTSQTLSDIPPIGNSVAGAEAYNVSSSTRPTQKATIAPEPSRPKAPLSWRLPASGQAGASPSLMPALTPPRTPGPVDVSNTASRSGINRVPKDAMTASPSRQSVVPAVATQAVAASSSKGKAVLGPTFTPTKQAVPISRRISDSAWVTAPIQTPPETDTFTSPPSFVTIQQQQRDQGLAPTKAKKSLLEIQEEEQAKQTEEDFLKWWAAEEERTKLVAQPSSSTPDKAGKKSKSSRKAPFKGTMTKSSDKQDNEQSERKGASGRPRRHKAHISQPPRQL